MQCFSLWKENNTNMHYQTTLVIWWVSLAHHGRDVDCPDEVTLWTSGHVTLEYVGFSVDSCYFGAIFLEVHFLHRPVLPVWKNNN